MTDEITNAASRKLIIDKISAYIGVPVLPTSFTQIENNFNGESLIVDNYPIHSINELTVDNVKLKEGIDYNLDIDAGLIYFKKHVHGFLRLEYVSCLTESQIQMYINPLVQEMLDYESDNGWTKNASSIKEGDVQINLDTSIGKGALIQKKLDELKSMFNTYARMI